MSLGDDKYLLIFDLDDTLIDTSDVYWKAKNSFIKIVTNNSKLVEEGFLDGLFENIDTNNSAKFGHAPERYGKSMADTYKIICDKGLLMGSDKIEREITDAGNIILEEVPKLIEGALDLLDWCKNRFVLTLITRGKKEIQLKKIHKYRFENYFDEIDIVDNKNESIFTTVIKKLNFETRKTWIIGDSLKSEIETGLKIGANCIFFNYQHPSYHWIQERNYSLISSRSFYKIDSLLEIPGILKNNTTVSL